MTREEAEKEIRYTFTEVWADEIIKALEQEPTTKKDLAVKCVSREEVEQLIYRFLKKGTDENIAFYEHFLDLPSVTLQTKKGHWIDTDYGHYYNDGYIETTELRCSCCNEKVEWDIALSHKPYYCENCGAKMVEPQESEGKNE